MNLDLSEVEQIWKETNAILARQCGLSNHAERAEQEDNQRDTAESDQDDADRLRDGDSRPPNERDHSPQTTTHATATQSSIPSKLPVERLTDARKRALMRPES